MTSVFPSVLVREDLPSLYDEEPETDTIANFRHPMRLVVEGQGIVAVQVTPGTQLSIVLTPSPELGYHDTGPKLELTETSAKFLAITSTSSIEIPTVTPKGSRAPLLISGVEDLYWLSVDKKNGIIRHGRTYRSANVTFLAARVNIGDKTREPGPYI